MKKTKFTPKTLAEFWANAPSEDAIPEYLTSEHEWVTLPGGPSLNSYTNNWRWGPQEKVIDLSCLVESDVLCQFWGNDGGTTFFDEVEDFCFAGRYSKNLEHTDWSRCIPALGIWQACNGRLPELPEGLDVTVRVVSVPDADVKLKEVQLNREADYWLPVAYRVDGKLDGYKWPWE